LRKGVLKYWVSFTNSKNHLRLSISSIGKKAMNIRYLLAKKREKKNMIKILTILKRWSSFWKKKGNMLRLLTISKVIGCLIGRISKNLWIKKWIRYFIRKVSRRARNDCYCIYASIVYELLVLLFIYELI